MSRVAYNHSLYRTGYRPTGHTNPFSAAHGLSGTPFDPTPLHGYPFSRCGGETLHGLGAMVPDQAIVNYVGRWQGTFTQDSMAGFIGAQDILTAVAAALAQDGLLVRNASSDAGWATNQGFTNKPFNVKLQIQVNTGQGGFGDPNDIISIIRHEVYTVTGAMPLADSIPTVQNPGSAAQQPTGHPAGPGTDVNLPISTDWGTWLQNNFGLIAMAAVGLVIVPPLIKKLL